MCQGERDNVCEGEFEEECARVRVFVFTCVSMCV